MLLGKVELISTNLRVSESRELLSPLKDGVSRSWNMRCLSLREASRQPCHPHSRQRWHMARPHTSLSSRILPLERCRFHLHSQGAPLPPPPCLIVFLLRATHLSNTPRKSYFSSLFLWGWFLLGGFLPTSVSSVVSCDPGSRVAVRTAWHNAAEGLCDIGLIIVENWCVCVSRS